MIVYWCPYITDTEGFYLNYEKPKPSIKTLSKLYHNISNKQNQSNNFLKCFSVVNYYKNVFSLSSPINLSFQWTKRDLVTFNYNQDFYNKFIHIRDLNSGLISFYCFRILLFAEDDLEMELMPATLENNDFVNNTTIISGSYNIGRWFRPIDTTFFIKSQSVDKKICINEKDNLLYLKFKTNQDIEFKKFYLSDDIKKIVMHSLNHKNYMSDKNLKTYMKTIYDYFTESKTKNYLIKLINKNLME